MAIIRTETVGYNASRAKDLLCFWITKRLYFLGGVFILLCLCVACMRMISTSRSLTQNDEAETDDCQCIMTDGQTELLQLTRYWRTQLGISNTDISVEELARLVTLSGLYDDIDLNRTVSTNRYTYRFSAPSRQLLQSEKTGVKFTIKEFYRAEPTGGGSTFKIIVRGAHTRNACAYRDHFDGTYTACCLLYEEDNVVDFYMMNVNYTSYQLYYSLHQPLYNIKVTSLVDHQLPADSSSVCSSDELRYWTNNNVDDIATWKLQHNNTHHPFLTKDDIDDCFTHRYGDTVVFAGDSHLRAAFGYLQYTRGVLLDSIITKEITNHYPVVVDDGMMFYVSTLMDVLVENLKIILETARNATSPSNPPDQTSNKRALLVIDTGCHDLAFNNTAIYIANFHRLRDVLEEIQVSGLFQMFYQNIPPWPHTLEHDNHRHLNTFVNAATSHWVSLQMHQLGIPVVDLHSLALPFEDMSVCGMHFLCQDFPREHKGVVGREAVQTLLRLACL